MVISTQKAPQPPRQEPEKVWKPDYIRFPHFAGFPKDETLYLDPFDDQLQSLKELWLELAKKAKDQGRAGRGSKGWFSWFRRRTAEKTRLAHHAKTEQDILALFRGHTEILRDVDAFNLEIKTVLESMSTVQHLIDGRTYEQMLGHYKMRHIDLHAKTWEMCKTLHRLWVMAHGIKSLLAMEDAVATNVDVDPNYATVGVAHLLAMQEMRERLERECAEFGLMAHHFLPPSCVRQLLAPTV